LTADDDMMDDELQQPSAPSGREPSADGPRDAPTPAAAGEAAGARADDRSTGAAARSGVVRSADQDAPLHDTAAPAETDACPAQTDAATAETDAGLADTDPAAGAAVVPEAAGNEFLEFASAAIRHARRVIVGVVGVSVVLFGVALIFLPGPAFVVIPAGLAILGTEFVWARRLLRSVRQRAQQEFRSLWGEADPASKPDDAARGRPDDRR